VQGLDDLIAKPMLSMADECGRDQRWTDWKGVGYTLRDEWEYVSGGAICKEGCTPGTRDANNDGKMPQEFLRDVNGFIEQRREAGHGVLISSAHAYLTLEEVLAVRLYSGPAFQPLNTFLRQIAGLSGIYRREVAQHPSFTFAATVGHLCRAIRKLAAVATPEEAVTPLWRGVRGELTRGFWVPDEQGLVCAVDMAFMSTSRHRQTPIDYLQADGEPNVLWALQPTVETDAGFHRGASIESLSQFAGEGEILFPPCTMLRVVERAPQRPGLFRQLTTALGSKASRLAPKDTSPPSRQQPSRTNLHSPSLQPSVVGGMVGGTPPAGTPRAGARTGKDAFDVQAPLRANYAADQLSEGGKEFLSISVLPTFL